MADAKGAKRYGFKDCLDFSFVRRETTDKETIMKWLPGCVEVVETGSNEDRTGIDYKAKLKDGAVVNIDGKARQAGAKAFWKTKRGQLIPDLALERWSVMPEGGRPGKNGWTLDRNKQTHLVLFTFDPSDFHGAYILSFHHLRKAYLAEGKEWKERFKMAIQETPQADGDVYNSQCIFVPVDIVVEAIGKISFQPIMDVVKQSPAKETYVGAPQVPLSRVDQIEALRSRLRVNSFFKVLGLNGVEDVQQAVDSPWFQVILDELKQAIADQDGWRL